MRKYRIIIIMTTILYFILSSTMYLVMKNSEDNLNNEYRVEISRLSSEIINSGELEGNHTTIDSELYKRVESIYGISYISVEADTNDIKEFYAVKNQYQMEIVPVTQNGSVIGYLKFDYRKNVDSKPYIVVSQLFLMITYILVLGVLIYTNQNIIKPFHQLSNMPYEMSQGNLNGEIKESKNRYFGRFIWGLGMLKDSLDRHKNKELKLAKDKKIILLSIAHDIKTPLNAISLYAKALEQEIYDSEEEKIEAFKKIQDRTAEINEFVNDIIKSSTEDAVTIEVKIEDYYLGDLIDKINSGYIEKCRINKIDFKIEPYENQLLKGDLDKMYEAVGNLMENAFKYGDGKEIKITFSMEDYCILIHVYNSGHLVKDGEQLHLFDSFYRGSNTEGKSGNGLGLYICREIIKKMNGDFYANQLQGGMEFVLVCPLS